MDGNIRCHKSFLGWCQRGGSGNLELPVLTGLAKDESVGDGGYLDGVLVELLIGAA